MVFTKAAISPDFTELLATDEAMAVVAFVVRSFISVLRFVNSLSVASFEYTIVNVDDPPGVRALWRRGVFCSDYHSTALLNGRCRKTLGIERRMRYLAQIVQIAPGE